MKQNRNKSEVHESLALYASTHDSYNLDTYLHHLKTNIRNLLSQVLRYNGYTTLSIPGSILTFIPKILDLRAGDIAALLNISRSKYYREIEVEKLDTHTIDKLSSLLKIYDKGIDVFEGDKDDFNTWLHTKNTNMGHVKPIKLMETEQGRNAVSSSLARIEHGLYG
ncbi:MAG: DUF2384 domain-containing protein [Cyclobacteriaceae bacterium]|nr:DUF2384 domain-containing protein [Cyclobacteriaceae bacterium]